MLFEVLVPVSAVLLGCALVLLAVTTSDLARHVTRILSKDPLHHGRKGR